MTNTTSRRELPPWATVGTFAIVIVILVVLLFHAVKPKSPSQHAVLIGPGSKSSYLSHYTMPVGTNTPAGQVNRQ